MSQVGNFDRHLWIQRGFARREGEMHTCIKYSITCRKRSLSKIPKIIFQDHFSLRSKVLQNAPRGGIMQCFRSALSYRLSLRSLFRLFVSGRLRQVLL